MVGTKNSVLTIIHNVLVCELEELFKPNVVISVLTTKYIDTYSVALYVYNYRMYKKMSQIENRFQVGHSATANIGLQVCISVNFVFTCSIL